MGLGIKIKGHRVNSSRFETNERWVYTLYCKNMMCSDQAHATIVQARLGLFQLPTEPQSRCRFTGNTYRSFLAEDNSRWYRSKLCSCEALTEQQRLSSSKKYWPEHCPAKAEQEHGIRPGAYFYAGLFPDRWLRSDPPEQVFNIHTEIVFNDGVGPGGQNTDYDRLNLVFGVSADIDLSDELVLTPCMYHQVMMDISVNDAKNETCATLSMTYKF